MKVAHSNSGYVPFKELVAKAKEMEKEDALEKAAEIWTRVIKQMPLDPKFHDRLMIVYRKLGNYKKELETIDGAISTFRSTTGSIRRNIAVKCWH